VRLWQRLFLLNAALLVLAFALLTWAQTQIFGQGLLDYVNSLEQVRAQALVERLRSHHQAQGSWQAFRQRPGLFRRLVVGELGSGPGQGSANAEPAQNSPQFNEAHRRPPPDSSWFAKLALYDIDGTLLAGNPRVKFDPSVELAQQLPIKLQDRTLAWLVVQPASQLLEASDQAFVAKKRHAMLAVGAMVLLLALLSCWWLARRLTAPLSAIQRAMADLGGGKLDTQIAAQGSDELGALAQDVNRLAHTLSQHQVARQQWAGDLAHELRTPLAILRSETEALIDGIRPLNIAAVSSIASEVGQLSALVDDLHQLSLSDLGALTYRFESVSLLPMLEAVAAQFSAPLASAQLTLSYVASEPLQLRADPVRLRQLLCNLLSNSLRYTDPGGRIEWQITRHQGTARLQLDDSAPGVTDRDLPLLFDRLYRSERARSLEHSGSGLGLSIANAIVAAHAGKLIAEHSPLGGLRILLELPLS
jgi:two-component system, OmpR family, sensor histidine kinase BaeS